MVFSTGGLTNSSSLLGLLCLMYPGFSFVFFFRSLCCGHIKTKASLSLLLLFPADVHGLDQLQRTTLTVNSQLLLWHPVCEGNQFSHAASGSSSRAKVSTAAGLDKGEAPQLHGDCCMVRVVSKALGKAWQPSCLGTGRSQK